MKNLKLEHVKFNLFAKLTERIEQDENLSSRIILNYNGNNLYGDINVKFTNVHEETCKIKFLQILQEEYNEVYQLHIKAEKMIRV